MFTIWGRTTNLNGFALDKLEPFVKSQPVPKKQDGPVRVVVAKTWKEEVLESEKDVLVEFYAPWYVQAIKICLPTQNSIVFD